MLEELQRYINNKFCVIAAKFKAYVDAKVEESSSGGVTEQDIANWNSAYSETQALDANYFPLAGGALTGTGGQGFVGFISQASQPATPANGFRLYGAADNNPTFVLPNGLTSKLAFSVSGASKTYTYPNADGNVVLDSNAQTISGAKTFTALLTATTIEPPGDAGNNFGGTAKRWLIVHTTIVNSGGSALKLRCNSGQGMYFQRAADTATVAGFFPSDGCMFVQPSGNIPSTSNGSHLQVIGNSFFGGGVKNKVTSSAAATLTLDANNTIYSFTGTTSTWTLPAVANNTGLLLVLINRGTGTITLNQAGGGTNDIYDSGAETASISLAAGTTLMIFNDGSKYVTM